ncbi:tRNA-uridine aminocarboxypropyltransferase 1-like [Teleopsis dalmanni]|uniref:tRNA-uridine aminocarboxypropyltransferase 1-like n=1 Tax=Teleopsis dalmanni TaxID=139649 RepID=UPI0018CEF480|nr:tRNA-uridine aminocarboxypropyltransferase 1-like [Teleopsis dalmanni]
MSIPVETKTRQRKYPFVDMKIADHTVLNSIEGRFICTECNRSRKFFCYNCYIPVGNLGTLLPKVDIPVNIDIIKHKKEIDGKSTAVHAAVLSDRVRIFTYPDIPDYTEDDDVVLIFPGVTSVTVAQLFNKNVRLNTENNYGMPKGHNIGTMLRRRLEEIVEEKQQENGEQKYTFTTLPIKRAVFIDSTWNQSRSIYKDKRVRSLKPVILQNRFSQFWRHQRGSPRWYLATIEAIHQFLVEVHVNAWGLNPSYEGLNNLEIAQAFYETVTMVASSHSEDMAREDPYNGQYDNLLFFFANMYDLIHKYYDHNELKSYRRPI